MRLAICLVAFPILASWSSLAAVHVVNPEGTGDFATIQAAVHAALNGDTIELTDGTFTGSGNRDIDFLGKEITIRSQNGQPASCLINCEGSEVDPHRGFIFTSDEGPNTTLEYVTITNGYIAELDPLAGGGGILCAASPSILGCVLSGNTAGFGGGVSCPSGTPDLAECTFSGNTALGGTLGGGLYVGSWDLTLSDCLFENNQAPDGSGGGIGLMWGSIATVTDCLFLTNSARDGGAIHCDQVAMISCTDCGFFDNSAATAGAIGAYGSLSATRCTFSGNAADNGGVINYTDMEAASAILRNCTLAGNQATSGGAVECDGCGWFTLENTIIAFNAPGASVQHHDASTPDFVCCDIFGNEGGDWIGGIAGQLGQNGNISEDPLLCGPDDFTLEEDSPCAPFTPPNEECDLIGAWPATCPGSPVMRTTWGAIKAGYRNPAR